MPEFPSQADIAAHGVAVRKFGGAPMALGTSITATPTVAVPARLSLMQRFALLIAGADGPAVLFAPQQPLQPLAQDPAIGVVGRAWDYPVGYNLKVTPRDGASYGFATLKALADNYDVLRGLIERVKDKVVSQPWAILPKKENKSKKDSRCEAIEDFLAYPDKQHTWSDWLRMLLEQVMVYDAPAVWLRPDRGGKLYGLNIIDGATISPKIMADGMLPPWDAGPAYQQVIKRGLPAVDYIQPVPFGMKPPPGPGGWPMPELLYKPRNPRIDSMYGFGVVEQMITTINIAIRREGYLLGYYTDGSTPDTIFTCPPTWTTKDIADFKRWWDSILAGNMSQRRGTMFVPDGAKPIDTKEKALTDETDQWLIRVMCFFLGLNPMPFIKMMNRASGEAHATQGEVEGQEPWQRWVSDFINHVIKIKWGFSDIEFRWDEEQAVAPTEQATIDALLVDAKIYHPDEIRAQRGDDAMSDEMRSQMDMATFNRSPNSSVLPPDQQAEADKRTQAAAEHAASLEPKAEPPQAKAAAKAHEIELAKLAQPIVTVNQAPVTVEATKIEFPKFDFPAINIAPPTINVHTPEMKAADVFVDVGGVSIKNMPAAPVRKGTREYVVKRNDDGSMTGEIIERRTVKSERGPNGELIAKSQE